MTNNHIMQKVIIIGSVTLLASFFRIPQVYAAAIVSFETNLQSSAQDATVDIRLNITPDNTQIFGSDVKIQYPKTDVDLISIENGGFFSDIAYADDASSGTVEIHGFFGTAKELKNTDGTIGIIHFKQKNSSIKGTLSFMCDATSNVTQILDNTGKNILSCTDLHDPVIANTTINTNTSAMSKTDRPVWLLILGGILGTGIIAGIVWFIVKKKQGMRNTIISATMNPTVPPSVSPPPPSMQTPPVRPSQPDVKP